MVTLNDPSANKKRFKNSFKLEGNPKTHHHGGVSSNRGGCGSFTKVVFQPFQGLLKDAGSRPMVDIDKV